MNGSRLGQGLWLVKNVNFTSGRRPCCQKRHLLKLTIDNHDAPDVLHWVWAWQELLGQGGQILVWLVFYLEYPPILCFLTCCLSSEDSRMVLPTLNITHSDIFFADIVSRSRCCQPQISIFRMFQDNSWHVQYEQTFVGRDATTWKYSI
jgi:hypothetical protein